MDNKDTIGQGSFTYRVAPNWETLPPGYSWRETAAVVVDSRQRVYVFNRGDHPMIVFDSEGNFIKSWGEGLFTRAHGLTLGPDDTLYCTDDGDHTVRQCDTDGNVLMTIGVPGKESGYYSGQPFNRCTHVAIDQKTGFLYVSDGYGNARVHKYTSDGKLLFSWGEPGTGPGEFNIVHNIVTDKNGYVYVADRENHRIQIFDSEGKFEAQWPNVHRPCALFISDDQNVYVGELGWGMSVNQHVPNIGPRISVISPKGDTLARIGNGYGQMIGQFIAPHGICLDADQNIYVAEVADTNIKNTGESPPKNIRSFQKLIKTE